MAALRLSLPDKQNWSCHTCSHCCRQHLIELTQEEQRRIEGQQWNAADGIPQPPMVPSSGGGGLFKKKMRLAHQPDGACVFLEKNGLCKIHAKFGEEAKPLACRIYPYAFHPSGKKVAVSLRFSCPSLVANRGNSIPQQSAEIQKLARLVVPEGADSIAPPPILDQAVLGWEDFLHYTDFATQLLVRPGAPLTVRLLRLLAWLRLVEKGSFDQVRGEPEIFEVLAKAAQDQVPRDLGTYAKPSRLGGMQFRTLVLQYARQDTLATLDSVWSNRLRLLWAALAFTRGTGTIPGVSPLFRSVPFASVQGDFGKLTPEMEELFERFFRVKLQGLHFCGAAYYGVPFVEGLRSLLLLFPAVLWLARWLAAGENRHLLQLEDVQRALALADHQHGYSPAFGTANFRRRVRLLARNEDIDRLTVLNGAV